MFTKLEELSICEQIDWLARFIIIHSIIYYDYNYNVITDKHYDKVSKQLASLIKENPSELRKCYYKDIIYDFDGNTGFDLRDRLTEKDKEYLEIIANYVMRLSKGLK